MAISIAARKTSLDVDVWHPTGGRWNMDWWPESNARWVGWDGNTDIYYYVTRTVMG